jgi:hypothetical protein
MNGPVPAGLVSNYKWIRIGNSRDHASRQCGGVLDDIDISPRHAATINDIIAIATNQRVRSIAATDVVGTGATIKRVVTTTASERVVASTAREALSKV